ncbi:MAG: GNAT family N-acetyltransferase [Micromonosporaceae bacterium]
MEIRELDAANLDVAFDIRSRSFGLLPESARAGWRARWERSVADRLALGCYDGGGHLVAVARINRFRQWWQGRSLPLAGIGGVVVSPEARGQGVGRRLMLGMLDHARDGGYPLTALYPATVPLYRGCGWEFAGAQHLVTVPTEALRGLGAGQVPLRRVDPDDAAEILSVVRGIHAAARTSGPIDWEESEVRLWLADDTPYAYLAADGFLAYHWDGDNLEVDELVAGSEDTARALWSLVGTGSSIAKRVKACIGPTDPLRWLTREEVVKPYDEKRWMLRVLDLPAALAGRGYPAGVDTELTLTVEDPQLPANTGTWRLSVTAGTGKASAVDPDPAALRLGANGLAALYAGTPLPTLRATGLATGGDPTTDPLYDTVFVANPYLLDYF